eukprot:600218-Prymnesium_polylepis.2
MGDNRCALLLRFVWPLALRGGGRVRVRGACTRALGYSVELEIGCACTRARAHGTLTRLTRLPSKLGPRAAHAS